MSKGIVNQLQHDQYCSAVLMTFPVWCVNTEYFNTATHTQTHTSGVLMYHHFYIHATGGVTDIMGLAVNPVAYTGVHPVETGLQ